MNFRSKYGSRIGEQNGRTTVKTNNGKYFWFLRKKEGLPLGNKLVESTTLHDNEKSLENVFEEQQKPPMRRPKNRSKKKKGAINCEQNASTVITAADSEVIMLPAEPKKSNDVAIASQQHNHQMPIEPIPGWAFLLAKYPPEMLSEMIASSESGEKMEGSKALSLNPPSNSPCYIGINCPFRVNC